MGIIGRARENELADRSLTTPESSASIFLGSPGIGKTAFLQDLAERHRATLLTVNRSERMWTYSGLSAFGTALGGDRAAAIDRICSSAEDWTDFRVADETSRALHTLAGEPRIVFIDDIDLLDSASSLALAYVFGRLHGTGIRVLATATRIDARHPLWTLAHGHLSRLTHAESVEFAAVVFGRETARGVLHIIAESAGGNPSAIGRVRLAPRELAGASALPIPLRLRGEGAAGEEPAAISRSAATRRLTDLVALAPETARIALGELVPGGESEIDDLVDAGILDSHQGMVRLVDPSVRVSVYGRMDARARLDGHVRLAQSHHGLSPRLERWHEGFVESTAVDADALLADAVRYAREGDSEAAVEFAESALAQPVTSPGLASALLDLSQALCDRGYFALAELYLGRVATLDHHDRLVDAAIVSLRIQDALDVVVDDAIVDNYLASHADDDSPGCVRLLEEAARIRIRRREHQGARLRLTAARRLSAAPLGLAHHLMSAIAGLDEPGLDAPDEPGAERFERLLREPTDPDAIVELTAAELAMLLRYLTLAERYGLCRRRAAFQLERLPHLEPFWEEAIRRLLVENEVRAGNPSGAIEALEAWDRASLSEIRADAARLLSAIGALAVQPETDLVQLERMVAEGRALCRREHNVALMPMYAILEARLALATGRREEAVELFREGMLDVHAPKDPAVMRCAPDLIETLWSLGRREEAREALGVLVQEVQQYPTRWGERALTRSRAVCAPGVTPGDLEVIGVAPFGALTSDEMAVARLVHRGLRNREIAAELFVSTRTVELRLTRIYRKLEVRSRSHLISVLVDE